MAAAGGKAAVRRAGEGKARRRGARPEAVDPGRGGGGELRRGGSGGGEVAERAGGEVAAGSSGTAAPACRRHGSAELPRFEFFFVAIFFAKFFHYKIFFS